MATSPKAQASKVAPVHQHSAGAICAKGSDGVTRYAVILGDTPSCTCRGFQRWQHCYHLDTARARFGAFYTAPWAAGAIVTAPAPPSLAAAAVAHTGNCLLYTDPDCPACRQPAAA